MHKGTYWKHFNVGPIHYSLCGVGGRNLWWVYLKFHDKFQDSSDNDSIEGNDEWWQWEVKHDERSWKCGQYQILCGDIINPWVLKPSHTVKACVWSNDVEFWCIHAHTKEISMLAPFTTHCVTSVDDISDWHVGRGSMKFKEISHKSLTPLTPNPLTLKYLIPNPQLTLNPSTLVNH